MFGLLLSSVLGPPFQGTDSPLGLRPRSGRSEVTSTRQLADRRSEGGTGPTPHSPSPRRVDNLRTEWLSIYLLPPSSFTVGLPCSLAGLKGGNPGTPMDPTRHSCPTDRVCDARAAPRRRRGSMRDPVGRRVQKTGDAAREKESSSKGLRDTSTETPTTSSLLVNL